MVMHDSMENFNTTEDDSWKQNIKISYDYFTYLPQFVKLLSEY